MSEDNQIELDLTAEDASGTEVEILNEESDNEDSFEKAESSTQKRIDRLTKKMREAERRESEALNFAKQVQ